MMEKLIKDPLTLKRWRTFKSRKVSWIALWFFCLSPFSQPHG